MNVPIHLLKALVVVSKSSGLVEAAARLGVTQPALSKQLRSLESALPFPVFTMSGRRKDLTPYGRSLASRLSSRLSGLDDLVLETSSLFADPSHAVVRVAARREIVDRVAGQLAFPGLVEFSELGNDEIVRGVLAREFDLGVVHSVPSTYELKARTLFRESFQLAIPRALMPRRRDLRNLSSLPCVSYKRRDDVLLSYCKHLGIAQPRVVRTSADYLTLAKMIDAGLGWGILPSYLVSGGANWVEPISGHLIERREFFLIHRPEFGEASWARDIVRSFVGCFK